MSLKELFKVIFTFRIKIIVGVAASTFFYAMFLITLYPVTYNSTVSIFPPEAKQASGLSALLQGSDFSSLIGGGSSATSQLFAEIIKSRSASEFVIDKFKLSKLLDKNKDKLIDEMMGNLEVEVTKEGIVKVAFPVKSVWGGRFFSDTDSLKNFSAMVSNAYIEALDDMNKKKLSSKAKRARIYIEEQIIQTKVKLDSAETDLLNFQKENKTISLPDQIKAAIETAAKIKGEIIITEINLNLMGQNFREDDKSYLALKAKLDELKEQYRKIESTNDDFLLSFQDAPDIGKKFTSLMREVKILNEVYALLQQQYYREKIQENRDLSTIEIMDEAVPSAKADSPRILPSILLAVIFFTLLFILINVFPARKVLQYLK